MWHSGAQPTCQWGPLKAGLCVLADCLSEPPGLCFGFVQSEEWLARDGWDKGRLQVRILLCLFTHQDVNVLWWQ